MSFSPKVFASAGALVIGLAGMAYAAGDHPMGDEHSQAGQQTGQAETITGEVQKKEGEMYTISTEQGDQIRLHIEEAALQGKEVKEGDQIQAKILKGTEEYIVLSAQRAGEGTSLQAQPQAGQPGDQKGQQEEKFTKTISGEIKKVDGNVYYVQDPSGKEIRLRLDQSAEKTGDLKEGDTIEALVTQEKEFHVISVEPSEKQ